MSDSMIVAEVHLWGTLVGHVSWDEITEFASFEYDQKFLQAPVQLSPLKMLRINRVYVFKELNRDTFKGLPGMLSDSLPDKFGNALIDVWLAKQGRKANSFNPIERLCYIGSRGMGALEYKPSQYQGRKSNAIIDLKEMVVLASKILSNREKFIENINENNDRQMRQAMTNLLVVGTSAGGARAKCIIAYDETTGEVRSGQIKATENFTYWLLKLDGIANNKDKELSDPAGYGRIEYAYYLMAKDCGIEMSESRLLEENGRAHFMTKRFDRLAGGEKLHMQSLCAMAHYDFNMAGGYSYEQVFDVIRAIVTDNVANVLVEQFKRAVFNVIGRNQDDHTKNIAFLMDKKGRWMLSPAFDMTYGYNPDGEWTNRHQMSINDKRNHFVLDDLLQLAKKADIKQSKAKTIINEIGQVFLKWKLYAKKATCLKQHEKEINKYLRVNLI
ncbi:MAG: type II toxin-antitoxin system HipA family toxin [Methylococcales bacterium]|jgi:serine/threonine-protein kinase HipA|nr:type II toxin-antitoxin system HipA family toxin [Methylococcales bacterium]